MNKLLNAYRADPSFKNARKLRNYERSHAMAVCLLTMADAGLLAIAIRHSNTSQD